MSVLIRKVDATGRRQPAPAATRQAHTYHQYASACRAPAGTSWRHPRWPRTSNSGHVSARRGGQGSRPEDVLELGPQRRGRRHAESVAEPQPARPARRMHLQNDVALARKVAEHVLELL